MLYLDTFGASGGVGRCSLELLPHLARRLGEVTVAGRSHVVDSYRAHLPAGPSLHFRNLEAPRLSPAVWHLKRLAKDHPSSPRYTRALLKRAGVGQRDSPSAFINFPQELAPPKEDFDFDILLHDLNWRHYPENVNNAEETDRFCAGWVHRAKRIFTNSDFTRREVLDAYGVEPPQVIAAPLAPPPSLAPAPLDESDLAQLRAHGLEPNGYFFYPAVHGLHKGHDLLAEVLLQDSDRFILPLVITAPVRIDVARTVGLREHWQALSEKLEDLQRKGRIISLPGLSWKELTRLANGCRAYVLPSRFEGFGFPLVEAMALEKLSLCSDIPAHREILSRYSSRISAATFPSGDAFTLRQLLIEESTRTGNHPERRTGSLGSAPHWTWADTAKAITDALWSKNRESFRS